MFEPPRGLGEAQICSALYQQVDGFDGENSETDSSLDFAKDCQYISLEQHNELTSRCEEIGKMLGGMIKNPRVFLTPDF